MRALNTLSAVGTTNVELGEMQFVREGHVVYLAGADSVVTATLRGTMNDAMIFTGPLGIEESTDKLGWPRDLLTLARVPAGGGNIILTLGGTVAGARLNLLDIAPNEPRPF